MHNTAYYPSTIGLALIASLTSSCLMTKGVINKAYDKHPPYVDITRIVSAATFNETLFLTLEIQSRRPSPRETVLYSIPFDDIGGVHHGPPATPLTLEGISLQAPALGYISTTGHVPEGATAQPIEFFNANQVLADHIHSLPVGIHVLVQPDFDSGAYPRPKGTPTDASIPPIVKILVVRSIPDLSRVHASLRPFSEVPKKHRAWLFMTPLTIVGDIITSPFQLLIVLGD